MDRVTADNLTDEQVREHGTWLRSPHGNLFGLERREALRDCIAALSTSVIVVSSRTKPEARDRIAVAINARREGNK